MKTSIYKYPAHILNEAIDSLWYVCLPSPPRIAFRSFPRTHRLSRRKISSKSRSATTDIFGRLKSCCARYHTFGQHLRSIRAVRSFHPFLHYPPHKNILLLKCHAGSVDDRNECGAQQLGTCGPWSQWWSWTPQSVVGKQAND
jgi:hypothetical protein